MKDEATLVVPTSPDQLPEAMSRFVDYYSRDQCHGALGNVTPDDVWSGRREAILNRRKRLAIRATVARREQHRGTMSIAETTGTGTPEVSLHSPPMCLTNAQDLQAVYLDALEITCQIRRAARKPELPPNILALAADCPGRDTAHLRYLLAGETAPY